MCYHATTHEDCQPRHTNTRAHTDSQGRVEDTDTDPHVAFIELRLKDRFGLDLGPADTPAPAATPGPAACPGPVPPDLGVHHAREPLPLPATTDGMASLALALNLPEEADALAALAAIDAHEFGGGRPWPCRHFWRSLLCRQMGEGTAVLMRDTDGHAAEEEVEQEEEEEDEGEGEEDGGEMSTTY